MEGDEVTSLPPTGNKEHPLYEYFDAGFHMQCFQSWDKKEEVLQIIKEEREKFINSDEFKEHVSKHGKPKWLDEQE